jgi:hypothetical protein
MARNIKTFHQLRNKLTKRMKQNQQEYEEITTSLKTQAADPYINQQRTQSKLLKYQTK